MARFLGRSCGRESNSKACGFDERRESGTIEYSLEICSFEINIVLGVEWETVRADNGPTRISRGAVLLFDVDAIPFLFTQFARRS